MAASEGRRKINWSLEWENWLLLLALMKGDEEEEEKGRFLTVEKGIFLLSLPLSFSLPLSLHWRKIQSHILPTPPPSPLLNTLEG